MSRGVTPRFEAWRRGNFGLPGNIHGLRHSHASILLRAGTPLKVASEALGHSSVAITADLYTHVLGELQRDAADRLSNAFDDAARKKIG